MVQRSALSPREIAERNNRNLVLIRLAKLERMSLTQLRELWQEYNPDQPIPNYRKRFLMKKLAWCIQKVHYGTLSENALSFIQKKAAEDPLASITKTIPEARKPKGAPLPGTRFVRIWHDRRYEVMATEQGFEFEGEIFRSLSAIATKITGTKWNGKVFFGLKD